MICSLNSLNSVDVAAERRAVLAEARTWLETPFHHGSRLKGVGVDCAQLLIAVYHAAGVTPLIDPGYYAQDWFRHERRERIVEILERFMIPVSTPQAGDVVLFRYGRALSHAAIVTEEWPAVIHTYRGLRVSYDRADQSGSMGQRFGGGWSPMRWTAA